MAKLKYLPYGQAHYETSHTRNETIVTLTSYETLVVRLTIKKMFENKPNKFEYVLECFGLYTTTTRRHISVFIREMNEKYGCHFDYKDAKRSAELHISIMQ